MHQTIHPLIGGEVYTDSKSTNRIDLSRFVQDLLNLYCFQGSPPWQLGGGDWRLGLVESVTLLCTYACTWTHAFSHKYPCMLIMINMAASMVAAICNFLTCSF